MCLHNTASKIAFSTNRAHCGTYLGMYVPRRTAAHFLQVSFRHAHTSTAIGASSRLHVFHINNLKWPPNQSINPICLYSFRRPSIFIQRLQINIHGPKRFAHSPADQETVLDRPPTLVRAGRKHRPLGLAFLGTPHRHHHASSPHFLPSNFPAPRLTTAQLSSQLSLSV